MDESVYRLRDQKNPLNRYVRLSNTLFRLHIGEVEYAETFSNMLTSNVHFKLNLVVA